MRAYAGLCGLSRPQSQQAEVGDGLEKSRSESPGVGMLLNPDLPMQPLAMPAPVLRN